MSDNADAVGAPVADPVAAPVPGVGEVKRYPVLQPGGHTDYQLVLIVSGPDEHGAVRGLPLAYERETGQFRPQDFEDGPQVASEASPAAASAG